MELSVKKENAGVTDETNEWWDIDNLELYSTDEDTHTKSILSQTL